MKTKVIFVHGFLGGGDTWGRFPELLKNDSELRLLNIKIVEHEYFTQIKQPFFKRFGKPKVPSISTLAKSLQTKIDHQRNPGEHLVVIAHSMGGLIARWLELENARFENELAIDLLITLATPHKGAHLAKYAKILPFVSEQVKELDAKGKIISSLISDWDSKYQLGERSNIHCLLAENDGVICDANNDEDYDTNICPRANWQTVSGVNHTEICKPAGSRDLSYSLVKNILKGFLEQENTDEVGYLYASESHCLELDESPDSQSSVTRVTPEFVEGIQKQLALLLNGAECSVLTKLNSYFALEVSLKASDHLLDLMIETEKIPEIIEFLVSDLENQPSASAGFKRQWPLSYDLCMWLLPLVVDEKWLVDNGGFNADNQKILMLPLSHGADLEMVMVRLMKGYGKANISLSTGKGLPVGAAGVDALEIFQQAPEESPDEDGYFNLLLQDIARKLKFGPDIDPLEPGSTDHERVRAAVERRLSSTHAALIYVSFGEDRNNAVASGESSLYSPSLLATKLKSHFPQIPVVTLSTDGASNSCFNCKVSSIFECLRNLMHLEPGKEPND